MKERSDAPICTPVIREREVSLRLPSSTHIGRMTRWGRRRFPCGLVWAERTKEQNTVCDLLHTSVARCKEEFY